MHPLRIPAAHRSPHPRTPGLEGVFPVAEVRLEEAEEFQEGAVRWEAVRQEAVYRSVVELAGNRRPGIHQRGHRLRCRGGTRGRCAQVVLGVLGVPGMGSTSRCRRRDRALLDL